jgi:hypothetical protein
VGYRDGHLIVLHGKMQARLDGQLPRPPTRSAPGFERTVSGGIAAEVLDAQADLKTRFSEAAFLDLLRKVDAK